MSHPPSAHPAAPAHGSPTNSQVTSGLFRFSVTQFLVALVLMLIANPILDEFTNGEILASAAMTLVLISAVLAIGGHGRLLVLTILLVLPALAAQWIDRYRPGLVPAWISTSAGLVFVAFVITQLLRFILRAPRVNSDVLCAGISAYLLLGLLWAVAYRLVARLAPTSFSILPGPAGNQSLDRFNALYYSFVSLTCLGCNDIVPLSRIARMLTMAESTTGVLYLAVMIARLVALYSRPQRRTPSRTG